MRHRDCLRTPAEADKGYGTTRSMRFPSSADGGGALICPMTVRIHDPSAAQAVVPRDVFVRVMVRLTVIFSSRRAGCGRVRRSRPSDPGPVVMLLGYRTMPQQAGRTRRGLFALPLALWDVAQAIPHSTPFPVAQAPHPAWCVSPIGAVPTRGLSSEACFAGGRSNRHTSRRCRVVRSEQHRRQRVTAESVRRLLTPGADQKGRAVPTSQLQLG